MPFDGQPEYVVHACCKCSAPKMRLDRWTSSDEAHEDLRFTCERCGHVEWVEGIDS